MLRLHEYRYHRPRTLEEALELVRRPDALPIAGGTDLVPNMKHRLFTPGHLVGLTHVPELRGISYLDANGDPIPGPERATQLVIGAAETLRAVAADPAVRSHFPALALAAGSVAGPQIRNRGTLGGNLCLETRCTYYNQSHFWRQALGYCLKKDGTVCHVTHVGRKCVAAHSADTAPVLIALGARVDLASAAGDRTVSLAGFFLADGIHNSVRKADEIVRRVRIPLPGAGFVAGYRKLRQRRSIDFPLLSIAVSGERSPGGGLRSLRVVISGLGARPREVAGLEAADGLPLEAAAAEAARLAHKQSRPLENLIVDPEWRRAMVPVLVRRAVLEMG